MSKKKGLGQKVEKSLKIMGELMDNLKDFAHMPLKKGLVANGTYDEDIGKLINAASEDAFSLKNKVDDLMHHIRSIKKKHNSRFANKVVARFLEDSSKGES